MKVKGLFQRYLRVLEAWEEAIEYTRKLTLLEYEKWPAGVYEAEDYLDWRDKLYKIRVKLELKKSGVVADFTGTDRQVDEPINAVYGVTFAAISFAVRCALGREIPVNHGFYSSITVVAPERTIANPTKLASVGAGDLEKQGR